MPAEQNVALYRRWLHEIWNDARYEVAEELIADDHIDHTPIEGQPPGRAGEVWAAQMVRNAFPDMHFTIDVVFADDNYVTGRWTMTGTHSGTFELLGIPPTGRPVRMGGQEIFRVVDGKLAEVWHCEEVASMLEQLKLGPPPKFVMKATARRSARQYRRERRSSRR